MLDHLSTQLVDLYGFVQLIHNIALIDKSSKLEKDKTNDEKGKPPFRSREQLIEALIDQGWGDYYGISRSNLENKFAEILKHHKSEN